MTRTPAVHLALAALVLGTFTPVASAAPPSVEEVLSSAPSPTALRERLARYVPVELGVADDALPPTLATMTRHLVRAADAIDAIYWQQVSPDGYAVRQALASSSAPGAADLAALMDVSYGPWDRHADDRPLYGRYPRPAGANFYPVDMTRRELDTWVLDNAEQATSVRSAYTVVRRDGDRLRIVPYSDAYLALLKQGASALRAAAAAYHCDDAARAVGRCDCDPLVKFLEARAEALLSDDYRKSEMMWLEPSACPLDIAIGPYEYYEDRLLGLKTAFEAIITLRNEAASKRVAAIAHQTSHLVDTLPVPEATRARLSRIRPATVLTLADLLYSAGDARSGYQLRAYILPNDEVVRRARGHKQVILANVVKAKFDSLIVPLAKRALTPQARKDLSSDAYLDLLIAWELGHGLVPGPITLADGSTTTARQQLRERYTIIEALQGEAVALWNYLQLADAGLIDDKGGRKLAATYLAALLDGGRLAASEPQAMAKTILFNYLTDRWVFRYKPGARAFEANAAALPQALREILGETVEIMARGDYDGAGRLVAQNGIVSAAVRQKLADLADVPLDIRPRFRLAPTSASR